MKKIYTLLLLFTITLFYSIPTQAYNIPLNYGVSDNDQAFVQTKNLFENNVAGTLTVNGITIESFGNGEFLINGQATTTTRIGIINELNFQPSAADIFLNTNNFAVKNATSYRISFSLVSGTVTNPNDTGLNLATSLSNFLNSYTLGGTDSTTAVSTGTSAYLYIGFNTPSVFTNYRFKVQIEEGTTRTSYAPYGFLSLNDIFVDSNILLNPNFNNGTTDWTGFNVTFTVSDNTATFLGLSGTGQGIFQNITNPTSNSYFLIGDVKSTSNLVRLDRGTGLTFPGQQQFHSGSGNYETLSIKYTSPSNFNYVIRDQRTSNWDSVFVKNTNAINLNSLGIDNLTLNQLNGLYQDFRYNSIYDQGYNDGYTDGYNDGYTDGYNDGYDEGFDDGVASDTSYAVGYALGLSEGEDMETGSSLLILIVALIGFVMMIFGFTTKRGIFNLLSVAAFVVLGGLLIEFVGFIIITFGLVLINIYYAFFGDL
jgi:hypothetical protein